jgi:pyruvate/2-oxoglutarate dehydrogenase complex dihydrolipoamide acyltransferase (E2) component
MDLRLAQYGMGMQEATIIAWRKQEGESFAAGEILVEVEAAKATVEVEAQTAGVIARIIAQPDEVVPVGGLLAELTVDGEAVPSPSAVTPAPAAASAPAPVANGPAATRSNFAGGQVEPRARKLASDAGIDLSQLQGSGPGGRIVEADVRAAIAGQ